MADRPLLREDLADDPVDQFGVWFSEAEAAGEREPEAMALATAGADGRSSVRFVLMRGYDERGFVFYTNSRSRKGRELAATTWASLAFRWVLLDRQVRVAGPAAAVDAAQSDAYFAGRSRGSQLGAWASEQSAPVADHGELARRLAEVTARFDGVAVPRPPWWYGFRVQPAEVEFWQQGQFRLHDRFVYLPDPAGGWTVERLHP